MMQDGSGIVIDEADVAYSTFKVWHSNVDSVLTLSSEDGDIELTEDSITLKLDADETLAIDKPSGVYDVLIKGEDGDINMIISGRWKLVPTATVIGNE